ncbi:hypothetical protein Tco_1517372 [Tanacetum coccineum]
MAPRVLRNLCLTRFLGKCATKIITNSCYSSPKRCKKEKEQKDKLNAVKARLIYGDESGIKIRSREESHYSESKTPTARTEPRRRHGDRYSRSPSPHASVFKRLKKCRSPSPRPRPRKEGGVFNRLGRKEPAAFARSHSRQRSPQAKRTEVEARRYRTQHRRMHAAKEANRRNDQVRKVVAIHQRIKTERQAESTEKGEASEKDKPLAILMIQPWERVAKPRITQSFSPETAISFPPLGKEDGTEGPMIIEAEMGGHFVHRVYVDGGASSEVLYEHCFVKLRKEIRDQMVPATTHLIGFSGETIWPLGQIALLVKIGDEAKHKENPCRTINNKWDVKIPRGGRHGNATEQQNHSHGMCYDLRT